MQGLIAYEVPEWLLKLVASYLERRTMQVKYRGHISAPRQLPGSSPQGTLLGLLLFILTSNETCMTFEPLPQSTITRNKNELVQLDEQKNLCRAKFVDDVTTAEAVNINKITLKMQERIIGPLPFQDSSDHELAPENSLLQQEISKAKESSDDLKMILNADKTKAFVINYSHNYQFRPRFRVPGSEDDPEVVTSVKLVGVTLSADLKFHEHVNKMVKSANGKMWMLRRLKEFGLAEKDLIEIYTLFIRSQLEYCAPA